MKYDFEHIAPRYNIGSQKWDEMQGNPAVTDDVIPFSVADMEIQTAPEIKQGLKNFIDRHVLGYSGAKNEAYTSAVCSWMKRHHNWEVKPEWMIDTHSVVNAFFMAVRTYTQKGDGVMLFTPVYYPMYKAISINQRKLIESPLINNGTQWDIDWQDFKAKAELPETKLLILCSPHNPCSRIWTREELTRISEICLANDVFVVSDEIHSDLIMPGYEHVSYGTISEAARENCIVCTAPSKTFNLAGMQLSNIFIPNEYNRRRFKAEQAGVADFGCSILAYEACRIAYEQGEEWLRQLIDLVYNNQKIVADFMQKYFPQIKLTKIQATYLLWMDLRAFGLSKEELEHRNRRQAALYFDEGYIFGSAGAGFERWNLACPSSYIEKALARFYEAYKEFAAV